MKERFTVISSSLGDYFGVGYNTVEERFSFDLGEEEQTFDEESQDRLDLGIALENGCMDYFEKKMGIVIDERNSEMKVILDGKLKCKRDGRTFIDGIETGWENKYSNASSSKFTENMGYYLQCQAYMLAWDLDQWVLAGMQNGKPAYKLIKRNEEVIKDIITVVDKVTNILMGIEDVEDYCWDIVDKYSKQVKLKTLDDEDVEDEDKELLLRLGELKTQKSLIDKEIDELSEYIKANFDDSQYTDGVYKYTVTTSEGRKSFDIDTFSIEHPTIDLSKYYKSGNTFKTIRCTKVRRKEEK